MLSGNLHIMLIYKYMIFTGRLNYKAITSTKISIVCSY